jgi:hypothetical protein
MATNPLKYWIKCCSWVAGSAVAIIGYFSERSWLISVTNVYAVGFFEGACMLVAIFAVVDRYGESVAEAYSGLRELGKLKKPQEKSNNPLD